MITAGSWRGAGAAIAVLAALAACDDGSDAAGPGARSEGEVAALADAQAMLDSRESEEEPAAEAEASDEDGNN